MNDTTALAPIGPTSTALARPLEFTPEQGAMIRTMFARDASDGEFAVLLEVSKARRLNPLLKQCHYVKRWDTKLRCEVWAVQVSIDGQRAIAERTGRYDGQDEPEFTEEGGRVVSCKVRVYRKDWSRPAVGVAYFREYVQTTKEGAPTSFWSKMPHTMVAKCAEALAIRKAFPEDTAGLYVSEEMDQASNGDAVLVEHAPAKCANKSRPASTAPAALRVVPPPTDATEPLADATARTASVEPTAPDAMLHAYTMRLERVTSRDAFVALMNEFATVAPGLPRSYVEAFKKFAKQKQTAMRTAQTA